MTGTLAVMRLDPGQGLLTSTKGLSTEPWWIPRGGWQPAQRASSLLQNVGCDFEIDSGAVEDRCGVCQGNGSTCHTVSRTFEEAEGLGMVGTAGLRMCALVSASVVLA